MIGQTIGMSHYLSRQVFECDIAAGMIAVVVRVDEQIEGALRLLADVLNEVAGLFGKLRVHHNNALRIEQPADGAAAFGEKAYVAANELHVALRQLKPVGQLRCAGH